MSEAAWIGLGAIVATFVGPIAAVLATRLVDDRREKYRRRLDLFRLLMKSRRSPLSPDFVGALNLIEVEFVHDQNVLGAWRELLTNLTEVVAKTNDEHVKLGERREYLRAVLLSKIGKSLKYDVPQLEIFRGGYTPQGHVDVDTEQTINRKFLNDVATGQKAFPIVVVTQPPNVAVLPNTKGPT